MLLCTKGHFIKSLEKTLVGEEGPGTEEERKTNGEAMLERIRLYATDETAKSPGADVWFWTESPAGNGGSYKELLRGKGPQPGQRVVYVDGGFDLFSSGHIEFLRMVTRAEEELARQDGWYSQQAVDERKGKGSDYGPVFVVAGVHDDEVINNEKGVNYPIMNIFERGLCVLQCRVSGVMKRAVCPFITLSFTNQWFVVHQCRRFWRTICSRQNIPYLSSLGHTRCRLPRADLVHAIRR